MVGGKAGVKRYGSRSCFVSDVAVASIWRAVEGWEPVGLARCGDAVALGRR